ncbi:MAG: DEAD/DEAH box helicase, partial [Propionibacteriaceae bacterium]|nr:DEAD/DEAH box helicase [Propionibacteriaceae bacterium]
TSAAGLGVQDQTGEALDPWQDFMSRPAEYFAALNELGIHTEDEDKSHGDLPEEIVEAVRALSLDGTFFSGSLRGYQSFGARFALVQKKVIIGDEMGLGKTIEALAVLTHLRAKGAQHFLVICPAAVVTNWMREVSSKTKLPGHRIHGASRASALRQWSRSGGVAVTTFDTMRWLESEKGFAEIDLAAVVVDEAHYIKNPLAQRSQRAANALDSSAHAILLTGTPMENRLEEFQTLVGYLRPDLIVHANEFAPRAFRQQVAPAYLRRNQEDVLTELPDLVEVDEWLPMTSSDERAYADAVREGNFMGMRQAAMSHLKSAKLARLTELVEEAEESGRRVIVFSYFRSVLERVAGALPGQVFGPLTGSVPATRRQQMVDEFSKARGGAVLVAQIEAGGVGLNIQAASVVVICEPQLKPTTEWQAIARARRMGQLESVQVHRLLAEEGVDRRITEILARKAGLFEEFARVSETAGSAPEALDLSEAELAKQIVAEERVRLFSNAAVATGSAED